MNNHKMVFAVGLLALSAVLYAGFFAWSNKQASLVSDNIKTASNPAAGEESQIPAGQSLPAATGNIDDIAKAIEIDANNQKALLQAQESDVNMVTSDSAAINGFGQVYNENNF